MAIVKVELVGKALFDQSYMQMRSIESAGGIH